MEGTSRAARPTRASIRSTSIVIGGSITIEVANEADASLDSDLDDVHVALANDHVSSSAKW